MIRRFPRGAAGPMACDTREPAPPPLILQRAGPAGAYPPCRRGADVLDTQIITGANTMESADRTGPVPYRTAAVGGAYVFYHEARPRKSPVLLLLHAFPSPSL